MTTYQQQKKEKIIRKAVEDKKTIVTVRGNDGNPIVFDNEKKFTQYRERLMKKQQAN